MSEGKEVQQPPRHPGHEHRPTQTQGDVRERDSVDACGCSRSHLVHKRHVGGELGPSGALDEGMSDAPQRRKRGA